jgi:hypothetical protein
MAASHSGPGSPWSSFEDQALVVLVHDMGQNWELVSDALNSIVQLKVIYYYLGLQSFLFFLPCQSFVFPSTGKSAL